MNDMVRGRQGRSGLIYILLTLASLVMIIPFVWMLSTSLTSDQYVLSPTPNLIPNPATLDSYTRLFDLLNIGQMFVNSMIVAVLTTAGQVLTSAMAAYAFARMQWRGRNTVFILYLITLMVPSQVTIVPLFIIMRLLNWINTYPALILPGLFSAFGTFLLRQSFLGIPHELEEAAFLDGASRWTIFWRVVLPLSGPGLATLTVFSFMGSWNAYLWPLFVARDASIYTLPVGLAQLHGQHLTQWNLVMAGAVISIIPILIVYLFAQRAFVRGVTLSGIKG
ncbi:MAG TPA: carbohydrate ABC transporter permease [Aggregatilineales bacterium]|nr:carbohydrate ABC transporter permease [Aggregatilineales bacterium]